MYNKGFSSAQIAESLCMSVSGINYHLRILGVEKRNISEAITVLNKIKFGKKPFVLKTNLTKQEFNLKITGIMLYWGEGAKTGNGVVFSNSNPEMIKIFMRFLRRVCGISEERLRLQLHAYENHNVNKLCTYWSDITGIPTNQFQKTYIHKKKPGTYKKISKYGTVSIRYSDKELLSIILDWIQDIIKNKENILPQ